METGEPIPNPDVDFNSFGSPANTIDGLYCDWWTLTCISPDGKTVIQADHSVTEEIAAQVLPELDGYAIPFLWGTTPDADYIGGGIVDPVRWTMPPRAWGIPIFSEPCSGTTRLGSLTPTTMVPVTFDAKTGQAHARPDVRPRAFAAGHLASQRDGDHSRTLRRSEGRVADPLLLLPVPGQLQLLQHQRGQLRRRERRKND